MAQGSRPARVGDQIRLEVGQLLAGELRDPGLGFVTVTRVQVTPDLQIARIYYTVIGDEKAQRQTSRALARALPFVRRRVGARLRLRRVPEIEFRFDESIGHQDRVEQLLQEIRDATPLPEDAEGAGPHAVGDAAEGPDGDDDVG